MAIGGVRGKFTTLVNTDSIDETMILQGMHSDGAVTVQSNSLTIWDPAGESDIFFPTGIQFNGIAVTAGLGTLTIYHAV